jgi:single-stranded-DNA-specific exonuclease
VLEPRTRWVFPDHPEPPADLLDLGARAGVSPRLVRLLAGRGIADGAALGTFLADPRAALHDPALLPDAAAFEARVRAAARDGQRVLVFGDFDADGISGLVVMVTALRGIGVDAVPYVPSRLDEGHGLSMAAVDAAVALGARVIVTVDTGTTSVREVTAAAERGIDVLVTDHHRVPATLPPAVAIVNPHRPDGRYPDPRLSGSGVAFTLARLLLGERALELADLAALGTVADVAPLLGENRAIVRLGLDRLRSAPRPGMRALLAVGRVDPARVDVETLSFAIAPRINAAGRVGEAEDAARLLLATDESEATDLAATLEAANATRRDLTRQAIAEARTSPDVVDDAPATIVRGPWPVGIVGLVAGRLADERGRPAIVGAELGDVVRASCRGDGTVHLADALAAVDADGLLIRHGGHAGAAGFEIAAHRWATFRERFLEAVADAPPPPDRPALPIDLALAAADVDYGLLAEISRLAPWGVGNPEPLVAILGLTVTRAREANGGHTQLVLKRRLDVVDGIAFGWPELSRLVAEGDRLDVVARLMSRRFGAIESLQLEIRDAAPAGFHAEARAVAGAVAPATAASAAAIPIRSAAGPAR